MCVGDSTARRRSSRCVPLDRPSSARLELTRLRADALSCRSCDLDIDSLSFFNASALCFAQPEAPHGSADSTCTAPRRTTRPYTSRLSTRPAPFPDRFADLLHAKHCALHRLPVLLTPSCCSPLAPSSASARPDRQPFAPSPTPLGLSDTADRPAASRGQGLKRISAFPSLPRAAQLETDSDARSLARRHQGVPLVFLIDSPCNLDHPQRSSRARRIALFPSSPSHSLAHLRPPPFASPDLRPLGPPLRPSSPIDPRDLPPHRPRPLTTRSRQNSAALGLGLARSSTPRGDTEDGRGAREECITAVALEPSCNDALRSSRCCSPNFCGSLSASGRAFEPPAPSASSPSTAERRQKASVRARRGVGGLREGRE